MKPIFTTIKAAIMLGLFILVSVSSVKAATRYSKASGAWSAMTTWTATAGGTTSASAPVAGDVVYITGGFTVTVGAAAACASIDIASGSSLIVGGFNLTVSGNTSISGTLTMNSTAGTKTFTGNVTINNGGLWNETAAEDASFAGDLTNNGTFTASTGVHTFSNSKALNGTLAIPSISVSGTRTNNGTLTSATIAGSGTLVNASGATINYSGSTAPAPTLTLTAANNTFNYTGAGQAMKAMTYTNLTISGSGSKTGSVTANGILSLEGTATFGTAPSYGSSATLEYDGSSARTIGNEFPSSFTPSGGVVVNCTGLISINATRTVSKLTLGAGGLLTTSASAGQTFTVTGTTTLNGKFTVAGAGSKTFTGDVAINSGGELELANSSASILMSGDLSVVNGGTFSHYQNYNNGSIILNLKGDLSILGSYSYGSNTPAIWMDGAGTFSINTGSTALCKLFLQTGTFNATGPVTINEDFYAMWNIATGTFNTNNQAVVANWGVVVSGGTFNINGGSLTVGTSIGGMLIGRTSSLNGTVNISSGTLTTPGIYLGTTVASPNGTFGQTGGTINTGLLDIGHTSTFTEAGGTLNTTGDVNLGFASSKFTNTVGASAVNIGGSLNNTGTFTSNSPATPTINITGNVNNNAGASITNAVGSLPSMSVNGVVTNSGTLTTTGNAAVGVKGNWINNGTSVAVGGTVTFNGTGNQTISGTAATTFNNLIINPSSGVTVNLATSNINILSDLSVNAGTFDISTLTANRTAAGGTLTVAANATLKLGGSTGGRGASNFPNNFSNNTLNPAGTVEYSGAAAQTVYATTYGNLVLSNSAVKTLSAATPIAGSVTVSSNATYDLSTFTSNRSAGSGTFNVNSNATLKVGAATGGQTGSNFPSGFTVFNLDPASTVEYNSANTINQTVYAPVNYGNLVLTNATGSGSSVKTLTANISNLAGNLTVNPYTTFDQATFNTTRATAGGTLTLNANSVLLLGKSGVAYPVNFSTNTLNAASTVEYNGAATPQTIFTATYGNLILNNPTPATTSVKSLTGNIGIAGNLTLTGQATFDMTTNTANRTAAGGILNMAATSAMNVAGTTGGQTGSNFPLNFSSMTLAATSTVNYNAASSTTQTVFGGAIYGNLTLTNGTGSGVSTKVLSANISGIGGNLVVNSNTTYDLVTFTSNRTAGSGTMTVSANSIMKLGGTTGGQTGSNFPSGFASPTLDPASTINYDAPNGTAQTVFAAIAYGNLILSNKTGTGAATKSLAANMTGIAGNLTINTSATFDQVGFTANRSTTGGTFTITAGGIHRISGNSGGACTNNNFPANFSAFSFDAAGTTEYYGTTQDVCSAPVYGHLTLSGSGTKNLSSGITHIKGNFTNVSPSVFAHNSGTVSIEGTGNQSFAGVTYYNVTFSNGAVKTLGAAASVEKTLSLEASTTVALANNNLTIISTAANTANIAAIKSGASFTYGTGKVVVERYINTGHGAGQHGKSWQLLSTPTNGQSIFESWQESGSTAAGKGTWITGPAGGTGFDAVTAGASVKYFNSAINNFVFVSNTTSSINKSNGYFVYIRGDRSVTVTSGTEKPTTLRTAGTIYQPTAPAPSVIVTKGKYESVGNPYASAIDISYMRDNGMFVNLNNDVAVWDPTIGGNFGYGGYQTLSATNDYKPTAGSSTPSAMYPAGVASPYIQSGQAFFVHSATGAVSNGAVNFSEAVKYTTNRLVNRGSSSSRQFFRASLYNNEGNIVDGNAVAFDEEFDNAVDADDALKIFNGAENFGLSRSGQLLSVEGRKPITSSDTIFYNLKTLTPQTYQLKFGPENMRPENTAFLVDRYLNNITPLSITDSSAVSFAVTAAAGSYAADRFMVVFKTASVLPVTITSISANRKEKNLAEVKWKVENEINIKNYSLERSVDGRAFGTVIATLPSTNANEYTQLDDHPLSSDNYYRIRITGIDGKISYSAIVKIAAVKTSATISVYPNPVENKTAQVTFTDQQAGTYQVQFSNAAGQILTSVRVKVASANMVVPVVLPSNTAAGIYQMLVKGEDGKSTSTQVIVK